MKPKYGKCPRTTMPYTNSTTVIAAGGGWGWGRGVGQSTLKKYLCKVRSYKKNYARQVVLKNIPKIHAKGILTRKIHAARKLPSPIMVCPLSSSSTRNVTPIYNFFFADLPV